MEQVSKKYNPLPSGLTIKKSLSDNLSLFATHHIKSGTYLGLTHIPNIYYQNGYIRTPLGGFLKQSNKSNCTLHEDDTGRLCLLTTLDIKPGDEIIVKCNEKI